MAEKLSVDESLVQRLPLPLAKLCIRACNSKNPLDRHQTAYCVWEATIRLIASAAVAAYAERPENDPDLDDALRKLARPSLGDWWGLTRRLVPVLADTGDEGYAAINNVLLGRTRDDLPRVAALDAALREALGQPPGPAGRVHLRELFDRLVHYRNREVGHGAVVNRPVEFQQRMGRSLLAGVSELLDRLDILAGRRLVFVDEVRLQKTGHYLVEWYRLTGGAALRIESMERPASEVTRLPMPDQVYLDATGGRRGSGADPLPLLIPLRPLVVYDPKIDEVLFLNSRGKGRRCNYLCFTTGAHHEIDELEGEQRGLLARVLGHPVDSAEFAHWSLPGPEDDEPEETPASSGPASRRRIDEFELLSELGQGSMGTVFRAWQVSLRRQVALKVIAGANDSRAKARFRREVRALGRVDHPNLVKIFTSGFDEEPCYYTMELVEGASLSAVSAALHSRSSYVADVDLPAWREALNTACEESRKAETSVSTADGEPPDAPPQPGVRQSVPRADLKPGDRGYVHQVVELVRQVAMAAHALHAAGVVHRDIKPANVMVTADGGQAVLMDLGIAQLADDVEGTITRTREFIGTLRYSSPEQVLSMGKLDARSDIYSIGATLWELLTLRPIYGATDETPRPEVMMRITSKDPDRIRKYHPGIAADLEAIVQKCLEKDPARRYTTASDLADDLGRWKRGELVAAQPLTFGYLAGKFVRRHRVSIASAVGFLVFVAVGVVVAFVQILAERRAAIEAQQNESAARVKSERNFADARMVVDEFLTELSQEGLKDLPGVQSLRERFAREAVDRYSAYSAERPGDRSVTEGRARALVALGSITGQVGSVESSASTLEEAIRLQEGLLEEEPENARYAIQMARSRIELGYLYWSINQENKARSHIERAIREIEAVLDKAPAMATRDQRLALARAYNMLGNCEETEAARWRAFERCRAIFQELVDRDPKDIDALLGLGAATHNLGLREANAGNYAKALEHYQEDLGFMESARKLAPQSPKLLSDRGIGLTNRGLVLKRLKRPDESLASYQEAVASHRSAAKDNPLVSRYQWLLADSLRTLAAEYSGRQRYGEAQAFYEESCAILERLTRQADDRPSYGAALIEGLLRIAEFQKLRPDAKADPTEAQAAYTRDLDQAVATGLRLSAKFPTDIALNARLAEALAMRARLDTDAQRDEQAIKLLNECMGTFRTRVCANGQRPPDYEVSNFLKYAEEAKNCAQRLNRTDEVGRLVQVAFDLGKDCRDRAGRQSLGNLLSARASLHVAAGRLKEAIEDYNDELRITKPALEKDPWHWYLRQNVAGSYMHVAELYRRVGDPRNEVLAWREFLKTWLGPMNGMRIDDFVDPRNPADEGEAIRLRQFVRTSPGLKRMTIPAEFNGLRYPFQVYITNVPWPKDPLEDQARWLSEERGGVIPEDVRAKFRRVHALAHERNVSFQELCVAELGTSPGVGDAKDDRAAAIEAARTKTVSEIGILVERTRKSSDDDPARFALARAYQRLGDSYANPGVGAPRRDEAARQFDKARSLFEGLLHRHPGERRYREALGFLYGVMARNNLMSTDYDKEPTEYDRALVFAHRCLDLFESLSADDPQEARWRDEVTKGFNQVAEILVKAGQPAEAALWYVKALRRGSTDAGRSLAFLYEKSNEIAPALPADLRDILNDARETSRAEGASIGDVFKESLSKADRKKAAREAEEVARRRDEQIAKLGELANQYRSLARSHRELGKREEALALLRKESDTRSQQAALDPANLKLKLAQAEAELEIGKVQEDAGHANDAVASLQKAVGLGSEQAALTLAGWYETGAHRPKDLTAATQYRKSGQTLRARRLWLQRRYDDALPELKKLTEMSETADTFDWLGMCYGKLGRWDEAIAAYKRGIALDIGSSRATGHVLNLLEALITAERPTEFLSVARELEKKGWRLAWFGTNADRDWALYYGYRAIALRMNGEDASEAERQMRRVTGKSGFHLTGWSWDEIESWLKQTKIAPDRRAAVQKIIDELKGNPASSEAAATPSSGR